MKTIKIFFAAILVGFVSGCTSVSRSMKDVNARVEFYAKDFEFSDEFTAEATSTKVLGIDFERLLKKETGTIDGGGGGVASIPVVGNFVGDRTTSYALYKLMEEHPGYDVVVYPKYYTHKSGLPIFNTTKVTVTARLAKLKKQ